MSLCLILLILSKTDLMHIGNTDIFYFIIEQPTPDLEIRIYVCLSIRKLMSVVKDVDLEAMCTSIFLSDDDDDDDNPDNPRLVPKCPDSSEPVPKGLERVWYQSRTVSLPKCPRTEVSVKQEYFKCQFSKKFNAKWVG